jgi:hypothetical protein
LNKPAHRRITTSTSRPPTIRAELRPKRQDGIVKPHLDIGWAGRQDPVGTITDPLELGTGQRDSVGLTTARSAEAKNGLHAAVLVGAYPNPGVAARFDPTHTTIPHNPPRCHFRLRHSCSR